MKLKLAYTPEAIQNIEKGDFSTVDILIIIWRTVSKLRDKASIILWSSFLLLMFWGFHGDMAILTKLFGENWTCAVTFGLPWGEQLVSFVVGFLLVVAVPCLIIKFAFKEKIRDYGLGLPAKVDRRKAKVAFLSLLGITLIAVFFASFDKAMQKEYPLFARQAAGPAGCPIAHWWEFIIYELVYLLFFITIEFAFRGYLLFGLHSITIPNKAASGQPTATLRFGIYSILIQMLAYTTWHYGKPVPEMLGTIVWGVCVAAIALRIRSLWPIIVAHWLYNVVLDLLLWKQVPQKLSSIFR